MRQEIQFVDLVKTESVRPYKDVFELRSDRPMVWLQRVCFCILKRIGAFSNKIEVSIERRTIDGVSFMERLEKQCESLHRMFARRPKRLLIGAEDYSELMREVSITACEFRFGAKYYYRHRDGRDEVVGLTVQVIPWMRGILVMPE